MFPRSITLFLLIIFSLNPAFSQSKEALKLRKEALESDLEAWNLKIKEAEAAVNEIKKELDYLADSLKVYPIWSKGVFGTIGFNFSRFQNWLSKNESNLSLIRI